MTEIEIIIDGKKEKMTLEKFFESYWGLFRNQVLKVIEDELMKDGKIRNLIRNKC